MMRLLKKNDSASNTNNHLRLKVQIKSAFANTCCAIFNSPIQ